jgi:hypothetical protein
MSDDRLAALLALLNDPKQREGAIIELGNLRDDRAIDPLARILTTPDNSHAFAYRPRKLAAEALGKIGDPRALPALFIASDDIHLLVRQAVAEALGKIGDASAVPILMRLLKDEAVEIRQTVAIALGELGKSADIPQAPFLDLLADPSDVLRHLGKQIFITLGDSGVDTLISGLSHNNSTIRGACADLLAELKAERAYSALQKVATNDSSKWVRSRAQAAMNILPKPPFEYPTVKRNTIPPPSDTLQRIREQKADWSNLRSRNNMSTLPPMPLPTIPPPQTPPSTPMIDPENLTADQIRELLDQLDVRLANGEISEMTYQRLHTRWEKRLKEKENE